MAAEVDEQAVLRRVREHGQEHVLRWIDELDVPRRKHLIGQLAELDFDRLEQFRHLLAVPQTRVSLDSLTPAPVARLPLRAEQIERTTHR